MKSVVQFVQILAVAFFVPGTSFGEKKSKTNVSRAENVSVDLANSLDLAMRQIVPAIARLTTLTSEGQESKCNGTAIGSKYILTAGHCLRDQESCNRTTVEFMNSDGKTVGVYRCQRLIQSVSPKENDTPRIYNDFGIFEVSDSVGVLHGKLEVMSNGRFDYKKDQSVWIPKFDAPTLTKRAWTFALAECVGSVGATIDTKAMSYVTEDLSAFWFFNPKRAASQLACHLIPGNSGSALLDVKGRVVGITSAMHMDPRASILQLNDIAALAILAIPVSRVFKDFPGLSDLVGE